MTSQGGMTRDDDFAGRFGFDFSMAVVASGGCAVYFVFSTFPLFQILYKRPGMTLDDEEIIMIPYRTYVRVKEWHGHHKGRVRVSSARA